MTYPSDEPILPEQVDDATPEDAGSEQDAGLAALDAQESADMVSEGAPVEGSILEGTKVDAWVPMSDGAFLAITLYLPHESAGPQPCILEALPYRKDDMTSSYRPEYVRLRDEYRYAVARLDLRGTGSSGGRATDEYPAQEQRDLAEVLTWLAAQPWCDGNLGMYGTSYSGFNSLQMAVRAAAGAQGDHRDLRHRRPVHRRRPLHGRAAPSGSTSSTTATT